ncbi:MAG: fibronectin type III domain-containing protein, partial [Acutalibacteraceae bacterium]
SGWWLREISEISSYICPVSPYGYLDGGFMFSYDVTSIGIRPAMCIDLSSAPAQVKGLKAASKTSSTVTLSWSKASGAQKYEIFKYNQSTKKYTSLGTTASTSFKISNLLSNTKYMFAVSAYKTTNGNKMSGKKSALLTVTTSKMGTPSQVKGLKATQTASTITISWNKVGGSDIKYYIYSYNPNAKSKYKQIGVTTSNKFTVKKLKSGTTYRYAVRAFGVPSKKWGKMSAVLTTATSPAAVTLKVTSGTQQAKLTWSKATGTTGYEIFIATSKSGKYKKLASTKSINYTAKNLEKGKTYYFKVRAYKSINKINIYGSYSAVNSIKIK